MPERLEKQAKRPIIMELKEVKISFKIGKVTITIQLKK